MLSHKNHLIGLIMAFVATGAWAETLEDAWDSAINNNHQIKSAKADTNAPEQQLNSAQGLNLT